MIRFLRKIVIFAFFPCTRFEDQVNLSFRGDLFQMKRYTDEQKLETCIKLHNERAMLYEKISQLVVVCLRKRLKCVIRKSVFRPTLFETVLVHQT